ncbi:MAG TPA: DNA polymerase IV [Deltaproteobacteria bacterium]|jgi:DNA polymerase-4|nr:DNA polymerase IV [Deltaproteobacteria bacterium]
MENIRKIIHIDMDAFYASVEQRDNPRLRGRPVIVGGDPAGRGVVAACSYEARKFGVHSAMPSSRAKRLCPEAIFIHPRFDVYQQVSQQIMEIFHEYTDLVEPLSLDEAFLDVTCNKKGIASATETARRLRAEIRKNTSLTASAGVSYNKFLAKAASDYRKPDGLTVITPEQAQGFIDQLPIGKFFGVGKVTEQKMRSLGITCGAELRQVPQERLVRLFGKMGLFFHSIAHGIDERPVTPDRIRKSLGREITLHEDIDDMDAIFALLSELADSVGSLLKEEGLKGRTVVLKLKYHDFQSITRSITLDHRLDNAEEILDKALLLLKETEAGTRKVRLLGITVSNFELPGDGPPRPYQLLLPFCDVTGQKEKTGAYSPSMLQP